VYRSGNLVVKQGCCSRSELHSALQVPLSRRPGE